MKNQQIVSPKAGALIRIKTASEGLKPAERTIADFVLGCPGDVIHMSISQLAKRSQVGESTIMRFCRTIGFSGYQEFKLRLAQDLVESAAYIHEKISFNDRADELSSKIFQINLKAVEDTRASLDADQVDKAATALVNARKIEIYGIGYSYFTALDTKFKLLRMGLIADAFGDGHLQAMGAAGLTKRDAAIGISHSGASRDTVDALSLARDSGAQVIAITNFSPSRMTEMADLVLLTSANDTPLGGEVLTSRIAQLCVVDVLSAATAIKLGKSCLKSIQKTSEAVKNKRY
jgi:DNA-binding MurR/RpiR family transcriptional regulator